MADHDHGIPLPRPVAWGGGFADEPRPERPLGEAAGWALLATLEAT